MRLRETKDQILRVMQIIQANLNTGKGNMVGMVFLDLEKAFDEIYHSVGEAPMRRAEVPREERAWLLQRALKKTPKSSGPGLPPPTVLLNT